MKGFMKYLCLAWEDEAKLNELNEAEWDALRRETIAYVDALLKKGQLVSTEPLQSAHTAATVRVRDGKRVVKDGPFVETKETVGGYFVIDVRDRDEALEVAANWPSARFGIIEVRPLEVGLPTDRRYAPPK
jgi:hypothetical protein